VRVRVVPTMWKVTAWAQLAEGGRDWPWLAVAGRVRPRQAEPGRGSPWLEAALSLTR